MASTEVASQPGDGLWAMGVVDGERRRIERAFHDGPQQALVSLRIRLARLQEQLEPVAIDRAREAEALGEQVERLIEDMRELARDVFPSLLLSHGLVEALMALVRADPGPVRLRAGDLSPHHPQLESSVYFACAEALRNVARHAPDARSVEIGVWEADGLCFEVRDDGPGFDGVVIPGAGLALVRDRLRAVGGTFAVTSAPGRGTAVSGRLPSVPVPPGRP